MPTGLDTFVRITAESKIPVKSLSQGETNGCGTTCLAMALNSLAAMAHNNPNYHPFKREALDAGHRELNGFSPPDMLIRVARINGAYAEIYNHSSFDEINDHVNVKKHPVIALLDPNRDDLFGGFHYVYINDCKDNPDPALRTITYTDPASGSTRTMPYATFRERFTKDLNMIGIPTHCNNMIIALSSEDDLPPSRDVPALNKLATGLNHWMNNFSHVDKALHGFGLPALWAFVSGSLLFNHFRNKRKKQQKLANNSAEVASATPKPQETTANEAA
jgi:hypothetical protein